MKAGKITCVLAWILGAIVALVNLLHTPDNVVIAGVDISRANRATLVHEMLFIGFGFVLAIAAFIPRRWAWISAVFSAALYLAHWFPFASVQTYGLVTVFKGMFLIGWNPGLRLSFVVHNIILPLAFVSSAAAILLGLHRKVPVAQP